MKVKEIAEILEVDPQEIIKKLENVSEDVFELETTVPDLIVKKLSKAYKRDIKPKKAVKPPKVETQLINPNKEEKPVEAKKQAKTKEIKQETKQQEEKKPEQPIKKEKTKKEDIKPEKKEPEVELELTRVYDEKYADFEDEKENYGRIKHVKKNKGKNKEGRKANIPQEKDETAKILYYRPQMTVAMVADGLKLSVGDVVRKLLMLGYMASASDVLEKDAIEIIAEDNGYEVKDEIQTDITKFEEMSIEDDPEKTCYCHNYGTC